MNMNPYPGVLNDLGFASWIQRLPVDGHPAVADSYSQLNDERAFPPCFVPVLERAGTGPHYFGVLKHWFIDRTPVFVECSVENNYMLWEFARNEKQLAARLLVSAIDSDLDAPSDEFQQLADHLAFSDSDALFRLYKDYEDGAYERLPYFVSDPPAGISWLNGFNYAKIPGIDEYRWAFSPRNHPTEAFQSLQQTIGDDWSEHDDFAHVNVQSQAPLEGVRDIFLSIEPLDWGRSMGVLPAYELGDAVVVAAKNGSMSQYVGRKATIKGHAFDYDRTNRWSYVIEISDVPKLHCIEERDLRP